MPHNKPNTESFTKKEKDTLTGWIDGLPLLVKVGAPIVGAFMWYQNNIPTMKLVNEQQVQIETIKNSFASVSQYKDQQRQIDELRADMTRAYKDLSDKIDKSNNELKVYSDRNRERMEVVFTELKDTNRANLNEMKEYVKSILLERRVR